MKKNYLLLASFFTFSLFAQDVVLEATINSSGNSTPTNLTSFNGELLMRASNGAANQGNSGIELFRFTEEGGAELVEDLRPGANSSPNNFILYDGKLYFTAFHIPVNGIDLFSYDGTDVTSESLYETSLSGLFNPIVFNDNLYFVGLDATGTPNRLIEYDGTSGGPVAGSGVEAVLGGHMIGYNDKLLLYMRTEDDAPTVGLELYEYDFDSEEFSLIKDINEGSGNSLISNFTLVDGLVYFRAQSALWVTDGTSENTEEVEEAEGLNVNFFTEWNNKLYFQGNDGENGNQLYVYDPVADEVTQLSFISGENSDHNPRDYVAYNGFLYYAARGTEGNDVFLWRTNGVTIEQLDDEVPGIAQLAVYNNRIFMRGDDENENSQLFSFDPITLSLSPVQVSSEISIFPNPSTGNFQFTKDLENAKVEVYNLQGKIVLTKEVNGRSLETNLANGMYLVRVNEKGFSPTTFKVIVK